MSDWSPLQVWLATLASSICGALAVLFNPTRTDPISVKDVLHVILKYGGLGSGLGFIGYAYIEHFRRFPVLACFTGFLVGLGDIRPTFIRQIVLRIFHVPEGADDRE